LGGYTNAILLGLTALFMVKEAAERLLNPVRIDFTEAIVVAVFGLIINVISALILGSSHGEDDTHAHEDHNLKAAYVHVLTDALTSILAIFALGMGKLFGMTWPDAVVALIGAAVILKWAFSLLKSTGEILVDYHPQEEEADTVANVVNRVGATLMDFHLWRTSESRKAALITIGDADPESTVHLREELRSMLELDHITLEVSSSSPLHTP
jgi:cation diffusion facilitator family transporter